MIDIIFAYLSTIVETVPEPEVLVLSNKQYELLEFSNDYLLQFKDGSSRIFKKSNWYLEFKKDRILSYQTCHFCNIDKKYIKKQDLFETEKGFALNTHVVKNTQHTMFSLKPAYFVTVPKRNKIKYNDVYYYFSFVFNVVDMRKVYADTANKLLDTLPMEMVIHIFSFLNFNKKGDGLYKVSDFPFDFCQEFNGEIPKVLSKFQLKKLYEIGAITPAYTSGFSTIQLTQMTDNSYEHKYPNNAPNVLRKTFKSKEEMHHVRDSFLGTFFDE